MLRATAVVLVLLFTLSCDRESKETPGRDVARGSPSGEGTSAPTSEGTTKRPDATPAIRDASSHVTSDGAEVRARLLLSKITPGDGLRVALSVAPSPAPPRGVSIPLDWSKTLGSLRLQIRREGAAVADLQLGGDPVAPPGQVGASGNDVRDLVLDGGGMTEGGRADPWKLPKPDLFLEPGKYTLTIHGAAHLNDSVATFRLEPLAYEIVAEAAAFKSIATLEPIAAAAAAAGRSGKMTAHGAAVDDIADNRWFRFTGSGRKMYDIEVVDVLLAPDGTVVATHAFQHFTCVAAGTAIATPRGPVAIERLDPGDVVWGYDTERQERVETTVRGVVASESHELFDIAGLLVTGDHPVFADGAFRRARELEPGAALVGENGATIELAGAAAYSTRTRVFDLSVDWPHDYFAAGLLVHNKAAHVPLGARNDIWRGRFARPRAAPP